MKVLLWILVGSVLCEISGSSRILLVVPTPARSHHTLIERLAVELAQKGHQVTIITTYKRDKPLKNLEEVTYPNYYDKLMESFMGNNQKTPSHFEQKMNPIQAMLGIFTMGLAMTEMFLSTPAIENFLKTPRKYDLVIGEAFFIEAVLAGFSKKYNAPLIAVSTGYPSFWSSYMVGNPSPSAIVPSGLTEYTDGMTFCQRMVNFLIDTLSNLYLNAIYMPQQNSLLKKHFGNNMPYVMDIIKNTSLVLVNHHHSLAFPRPYLPNMIEIGGYHVRPVQPLPTVLKQYLDASNSGVILFSMGSHLQSSSMPGGLLQTLLKTFARLNQNVLWKYEDDKLKDLPKNVKVSKWLPQSDILAHPNVKLFITHGGLLSTTETVIRGVPVLGLPVFGDQPMNMKFVEKLGFGKMLDIVNLDESNLYEAINEVIDNPKYKLNVKKVSAYLQDTPLSAIDTAIYWIEYVVRHGGAPHLRSAAQDLAWYELYLVDVLCALLIVVVSLSWFFYIFVKLFWKTIRGRQLQKQSSKKIN